MVTESRSGRQRLCTVRPEPLRNLQRWLPPYERFWRTKPEGSGTRLLLEHRGFDADDPIQQMAHDIMNDGWRIYLTERLAESLGAEAA